MTGNGGIRSVPSVPLVWHGSQGVAGADNRRWLYGDDRDGGRNWAVLLAFAAMMSAPLWPCLVLIAI